MMLTKADIRIYGAGKTWAATELREMRDKYGFNINSRWIDVQNVLTSPDDEFPAEIHENEDYKREIWDNGCKQDCISCDMMVLLAHPHDGEKHSGSLVELGHVTVLGKPAYIIGTCASIEPAGHSDRAWKSQANVFWEPNPTDTVSGFAWAVSHYIVNFADQWARNRAINNAIMLRNYG